MCHGRQTEVGGGAFVSLAKRIESDRRLIDVTDIAMAAGIGYRTLVSPAVWDELIVGSGRVAGDAPDDRLWTLLHSLSITHRQQPESDDVSCEFGDVPVRAISAPTRVIGVYLGHQVPGSRPCCSGMPGEIASHLEAILDYLWDDERKHSETANGSEHIFESLAAIRNWLRATGSGEGSE